jgi:large subunit ribosomal protein L5
MWDPTMSPDEDDAVTPEEGSVADEAVADDSGAEDAGAADAGAEAAEAPAAEKAPAAKKAAPAKKAAGGTKKAASASKAGGAVKRAAAPKGPKERPRLKQRYDSEVRAQLVSNLGLTNVMEAPRLQKIVVNMGVGRATQQPSLIEGAVRDLEVITGQKPLVTKARRSIAGFKLRENMNIGVKVTMRGDRAWEFLDRLISLAIPRIRDFRGLSPRSFDGHGNYTFGVTEQLIFPEVDYDRIDTTRGMDITICTTARTDDEGRAFLAAFGFPFRQEAA